MKLKIDLTEEKFDEYNTVSFYDCKTIFFELVEELPKTLSFKIWGAGIMPDFEWKNYLNSKQLNKINIIKNQAPNNEVAIKGFGILTIENVVAGKIIISPYVENEFIKTKEGKIFEFVREWNMKNIPEIECYEYWLDTNIYFPNGACDLKIYAKGKVTFEFEVNDCVNYLEYITNPNQDETFNGYKKYINN